MTQPPDPPPLPPLPPAGPSPASPSVDWRRLLAGNWTGSARVAAIVLGTATLLAGGVTALVRPSGLGVGDTLNGGVGVLASVFATPAWAEGSADGVDFSASLSAVPLTLTVVVFALLGALFHRLVRDYPSALPALGDAARISALIAMPLWVATIVFRGDNDAFDHDWAAYLDASETIPVDYGMSATAALLLTFLVVFCVLALIVGSRRDWWPARTQAAVDVVVAALYGHLTLVLLLPLLGLLGFLLLGFGEESLREPQDEGYTRELLTLVVVALANGGVLVLSLGSGASIGGALEADGEPDERDYQHLWGTVTDEEPGLWVSPALAVAALVVSALVVLRRSRASGRVFASLLSWWASLLVVVPLLVVLSGVRFAFEAEGESGFGQTEEYRATAAAGAHGLQTTFFVLGIALLVVLALAALTRTLDVSGVRRGLAGLQRDPGRAVAAPPAPPGPTSPPPSQPPPPYRPEEPGV